MIQRLSLIVILLFAQATNAQQVFDSASYVHTYKKLYPGFRFDSSLRRVNLSTEEKLEGLSRVWQEARFNFANFDLVPDLNWDSLYRSYISSGGLENPFSTDLDGDGNNTAGGNFVRNFFVGVSGFPDNDGDGYGTGTGVIQPICSLGTGLANVGGDCNDSNASINPGSTELCGNAIDDNCDGLTDFIQDNGTGAAQTFSNTGAVTIPSVGTASPYPSNITISGVNGLINKLRVRLRQFSHTYPTDVDILLVGPAGQKMIIMSDVGGSTDAVNATFTLDDAGATTIPNPIANNGVYRPTNVGSNDPFAAPAPAGPYQNPASAGTATFASVFNNSNPNGTWSLYVVDDASGDAGSFAGGWELEITTFANLCDQVVNPTFTATQPDCSNPTGSINVTAPLGLEYTYSIGGAYQSGTIFSNLSPGNYTLYAFNSNTNITTNNGIDDDGNGFIDDVNGWDFSFNNNNPANNVAGDSHGTHVGGIIGARMDNNIGVTGVAGLTTIMPVQFYGTGGATWTATMNAQAFAYSVDNGAKIINTSYNIDGFATSPVLSA